MADGTASEKKTHYDYYPWNGREIRFYAAFLLDGDEWGYGKDKREVEVYYGGDETIPAGKDSNWGEYWWNASNTGYSMRKFLDPSYDATGTTMHTTPWFFIRLSEIYLNYAECQIELGNNLEALEYINKVRTRALLPPATGEDIRAEYIIRKTKCFDFWERNVLFPKTKRSFFRTPKHPLPCPFPLNFSLLIITKKFGNLAKNRYICIV